MLNSNLKVQIRLIYDDTAATRARVLGEQPDDEAAEVEAVGAARARHLLPTVHESPHTDGTRVVLAHDVDGLELSLDQRTVVRLGDFYLQTLVSPGAVRPDDPHLEVEHSGSRALERRVALAVAQPRPDREQQGLRQPPRRVGEHLGDRREVETPALRHSLPPEQSRHLRRLRAPDVGRVLNREHQVFVPVLRHRRRRRTAVRRFSRRHGSEVPLAVDPLLVFAGIVE